MNNRIKKNLGGFFIASGIGILGLNSAVFTGAVIGSTIPGLNFSAFILGLIFIAGGFLVFMSGLEAKIKAYEANREGRRNVIVEGIHDISYFPIQITPYRPFDDYHINLEDFREVISPEVIGEKDKGALIDKYGGKLKEIVEKNYRDYFDFKFSKKKYPRNKRDEIAGNLRIAMGVEKLLSILDKDYESRNKKAVALRNSSAGEDVGIYDPIKNLKAAYVRYTSDDYAKKVKKSGVFGGTRQSLFFPSLEKAYEFVGETNQEKARKITGANSTEKAIIFQTGVIPDKMNFTTGGGFPKSFFTDLEKEDYYNFKILPVSP